MLVENPKIPMERMYFRSPQRVNKDTSKSNSAPALIVIKELPFGNLKP
jgi:hypothetical protein